MSGKVSVKSPHCGGAMIRPEDEFDKKQFYPYVGKVFYVKQGKENDMKAPIVASFTVNAAGEFSIRLPKGTYSIWQEQQTRALNLKEFDFGENYSTDPDCLKKWWQTPYHVLEINNKAVKDLNFEFIKRCFINMDVPCIDYHGPLPP